MSNEITTYSYADIEKISLAMVKSRYFTDVTDQAKAIVKILAGKELGFEPFTSMNGIHIIQGKPVVSVNLMAAALKRGGKYNYKVLELTEEVATIEYYEAKETIGTSTFTIDDARKAGLLDKKGEIWTKYAKNMLFARAMSNGIRFYCPDVFNGSSVYTEGEIVDKVPEKFAENIIDQSSEIIKECTLLIENAKTIESLRQATKYGKQRLIEFNIPEEDINKFMQQAAQISEKFKQPKEEITNETK